MTEQNRLILFEQAVQEGKVKLWEDGGHSWLQVPRELAQGLKISGYSYQDQDFIYLEEDCDVGVFANALMPPFQDWLFIPREYENNSHVRSKPHYRQPVKVAATERIG